jgi:hypothetical protein
MGSIRRERKARRSTMTFNTKGKRLLTADWAILSSASSSSGDLRFFIYY